MNQESSGVTPAMQSELIWANEREVEPMFQRQHFRIRDETSCWYLRKGGVTMTAGKGKGQVTAGKGQVTVGKGQVTAGKGQVTADKGQVTADKGQVTADKGQVTADKGQVTADKGQVTVEAGNWLFPGAGEGEVVFRPGTRILSIRFRLLTPQGGRVFEQPEPLRVGFPEGGLLARAEALLRRVEPWQDRGSLWLSRGRIPLAENYAVEAAFAEWLSCYVRAMEALGERPAGVARGDERVALALARIARHPMRESFREGDLAAAVGIGQRQLRRLLERETGLPPYAHYDRRRLEMARHALRETAMPVKAVAYDLGFRAPSHFSNWFTKRTGQGPRCFRRQEGRSP